MLVLTRKPGENIRIGNDVVVTVLGVRSGHVKIGVKAPRGVPVHREEVYDRIAEANRSATRVSTRDAREATEAFRDRLKVPSRHEEAEEAEGDGAPKKPDGPSG